MNEEKRSPWIFILLLASSVLLLGIFIIALLSIIDNPWTTDEPEPPIVEEPTPEEPIKEEDPTAKFNGSNNLPAFTYPLGWHISILQTEETTSPYDGFRTSVYGFVNNGPISQCSGCDGSPGPIFLGLYDRVGDNDAASVVTQLLENLADPLFYTDVNPISTDLPNGRYTEITLKTTENSFNGATNMTYIVFDAGSRSFVASFVDFGNDEKLKAGWDIINDSFNFSKL